MRKGIKNCQKNAAQGADERARPGSRNSTAVLPSENSPSKVLHADHAKLALADSLSLQPAAPEHTGSDVVEGPHLLLLCNQAVSDHTCDKAEVMLVAAANPIDLKQACSLAAEQQSSAPNVR